MRSHAKASSAGSNSGRGASRRSVRRPGALTGLLVALLAAACFLPGSAFAIEYRTVTESFGTDGTSGTSFAFPAALAFDQGNERLYALDQETQKIHGFDASTPATHTPLGGSFPLTAPGAAFLDALAADSSSHSIYFASYEGNALYGFDESGTALAGFLVSGLDDPCGAAVDSSGNIWVAQRSYVRVYNPAGGEIAAHYLGLTNTEPCNIAFDAEENLYVGFFFGPTLKYTAASNYDYTKPIMIDPEFTSAMTVDKTTGEVFVIHYNYISVWDTDGEFLYEFGEPYGGEYGAIAIDEATEEAYVSDYGHAKVDVFSPPVSVPRVTTEGTDGITAIAATVHGTINPKGQAVEDCHFEVVPSAQFVNTRYENVTAAQKFPCIPLAGSIPADSNPHAVSAGVTGLNPASVYHYRLVAKNSVGEARGLDRQFTSGAAAPLVEEQSAEAVGTSEATLAAKINPRGGETTYHVEYGTTNAYGQSTTESVPFGFPADNSQHPVSVHIGGLEPGTAYHFRFVATNPIGTTEGADASFATYPAGSPIFAPCPNDEFRTGPGSRLPDCRAYEQGTPTEKHGAGAQQGNFGQLGVSASGDRFTFFADGGLPTSGGSGSLVPYLASRGPDGWSTDGLLRLNEPGFGGVVKGMTEDFATALISGEGPGDSKALYLRDNETGTFELGFTSPSNFESTTLLDFAADPAHLLLRSETQHLPSAPAKQTNLYDLNHGVLTLANRVPAGSATSCDDEAGPACVVPAEGIGSGSIGQISRDGSRVFFNVRGSGQPSFTGRIYMREDGSKTAWISASQRTTPDPGGEKPAKLEYVTPDGSTVFFRSCEKLTDDSTAVSTGANSCESGAFSPAEGQDLYSYDVDSGELTDLTVDSSPGDPLGATVLNFVGTSEDGSYVYFTANGVLAPGASPGKGLCQDTFNKCNLYLYHDGVTTFIARLGWDPVDFSGVSFRVSANGSALLFSSDESLTGYNNIGGCVNGITAPCPEFFRYSAPDEALSCLTCKPTGPPAAAPNLGAELVGFVVSNSGASFGQPRNFSADGNRFFFNSVDAMVPRDTNHTNDVYEWEAKGTGSCESDSQNGGCIYLITSGTDPVPSTFLSASRDGDHVFFFTEAQLVPTDQDQLYDVYDAGVSGGLAAQHTLAPPTCSTTACQANPAPPADQTPASATFQGPGNAHSRSKARKCPKGKRKVRSGGKVRCKRAAKQNKRHNNRGGSK